MALQFDPSPYLEAIRQREQERANKNAQMQQLFQNLGGIVSGLANYKNQQRQQELQNKQLGWAQQEQEYKYGKYVPAGMSGLTAPTFDRQISQALDNSPRPYFVQSPQTMDKSSTIAQYEAMRGNRMNPPDMVYQPGALQRKEEFEREDLMLRRKENEENREFNRMLAMGKFGLQQEKLGLEKETAEAKAEAERKAQENARISKINEANDVIRSVDRAIEKVGFTTTGFVGDIAGRFGGTGATDLAGDLSHINSLLGLAKLAEMKSQSKAGSSGMGALSEKEMDLLISAVESLKQSQSPQQLRENLESIKTHYKNWLMMEDGINPYKNTGSEESNDPLGIR